MIGEEYLDGDGAREGSTEEMNEREIESAREEFSMSSNPHLSSLGN